MLFCCFRFLKLLATETPRIILKFSNTPGFTWSVAATFSENRGPHVLFWHFSPCFVYYCLKWLCYLFRENAEKKAKTDADNHVQEKCHFSCCYWWWYCFSRCDLVKIKLYDAKASDRVKWQLPVNYRLKKNRRFVMSPITVTDLYHLKKLVKKQPAKSVAGHPSQ